MIIKFAGRVRGLFLGSYPENREDEQLQLNNRGDLLFTMALPNLVDIVRLGDSWQAVNSTTTAALTAVPTTAAGLSLANVEPSDGKTYIIDSIGYTAASIDTTQVNNTTLWCMNSKIPGTNSIPAGDAATTIRSLSGKSAYSGRARISTALTGLANDGWLPMGSSPPVAPAVAGTTWKNLDVRVDGLYIVPPGGLFSIQASSASVVNAYFTIRWHEAKIIVKGT